MSNINNTDDPEVKTKLTRLITTISKSGLSSLDRDLFNEVKKICKTSTSYVGHAYQVIFCQLQKRHSQVRLSAFQLCVELFDKSHVFRELVSNNLQLLFSLVAETNHKQPLPPPKHIAAKLKELAVITILQWQTKYGDSYKQIQICYNYLKKCKNVDFDGIQNERAALQAQREAQIRNLQNLKKEKMEELAREMKDNENDLEAVMTTLNNCTSLLLPPPEEFHISNQDSDTAMLNEEPICGSADTSSDQEDDRVCLRDHGITPSYSIKINVNPQAPINIPITEENSSVVENAKDTAQLIKRRFMPMLKKWLNIANKFGEEDCVELKQITEWTEGLAKGVEKYKRLDLHTHSDDDDDDDLVEVKKDGYEDTVEEYLPVAFDTNRYPGLRPPQTKCKDSGPATTVTAKSPQVEVKTTASQPGTSHLHELENAGPSTSQSPNRKAKLLALAPKLPYDIDLYHWEDDNLTAPTLLSVKSDSPKFWGTSNVDDMNEIVDPGGVASLRTRVIEYTGSFEPVKWSCRAPLPSGKLCPRRDRHKCPFHGKIVPRDETGQCQNPEDEQAKDSDLIEGNEEEVPDWQDPKLLEELKRQTGIDLKMPPKKGKGKLKKKHKGSWESEEIKKRNFPGLTEIKKSNCTYTRLAKKLFNRSALKRVATSVNEFEHKRHRDKFGDQFNYVCGTS